MPWKVLVDASDIIYGSETFGSMHHAIYQVASSEYEREHLTTGHRLNLFGPVDQSERSRSNGAKRSRIRLACPAE